jgi:hypothetical protein
MEWFNHTDRNQERKLSLLQALSPPTAASCPIGCQWNECP